MASAQEVAEELVAINRRVRALQQRSSRLKRKVVVNQDGPSELGGGLGDLAEGLRLTVPPYAQRVLGCVHFDAAGWFGSCSFLGRSEQAGGGFVNPEYIASPC